MNRIKFFLISLFTLAILNANAQSIRIENERYVNSTTYRFDIMFYGTSGSFEFANFTCNLAFNTSWPGGTFTGSVVAGSSELTVSTQRPTVVLLNFPNTTNPTLIRVPSGTPPGAGNGSIIPTTGIRYATIELVCASGFNASQAPSIRWNFTTPSTALNAYVSSLNTIVLGSTNTTNIANQVNAFNPIYWNGTAWSGFVFDGTANAAGAAVTAPTANLDATVLANLTASGDITCRSLNLQSGNTLNMQSNTLNLGHRLNRNDATLNFANAGLVLTGNTPATQNQSLSIGDVTLNNLDFQGSGTKVINDTLRVTGTVSQSGTAVFNANGRLILRSTATGTARVSAIAANSITGNVRIEQYFPAGKRGFRFIANPLSIDLPASQLRDDIFITGAGTGTTTLGAENSNGFDHTASSNPSAFSYNTNTGNSNQTVDPGWTAISNGNSSTIPVGGAWRVLVRGDRSTTGVLDGSVSTANAFTMDFFGPINDGSAPSVTLAKTATSPFNFIGNPLNSNINSNSINSTATLSAGIWVWNQALGTRGAYTTGLRADNYIIPARSGFFLRIDDAVSNGSNVGTLTFPEAAKTAAASTFQAFKGPNDKIVINVNSTGVRWDELNIRFDDKFKAGTDFEDIDKFMNPDVSLFSINTEGKKLAIDQRKPESQNIPLGFYTPGTLEFTFDFAGTVVPSDMEYFFRDGVNLTPITEKTQYKTTIDGMTAPNTTRFGIVVEKKANSLAEQTLLSNAYNLYPNPVSGSESISIAPKRMSAATNQTSYLVIDMAGKVIASGTHSFNAANALVIPTTDLAAGVYQVQIISNESISNLPFIKQ
jgi:hypothetical protein